MKVEKSNDGQNRHLWQMLHRVHETKQATGSYEKLSKKGMARNALHFEKLMPAKKKKMQENQRKTTAMIMVRDNKGLILGNGTETRKEGMK